MAEPSPGVTAGEEGIAITRVFDAPRERVWREWTEPERFADWYGGADAEVPRRRSRWTSARAVPGG